MFFAGNKLIDTTRQMLLMPKTNNRFDLITAINCAVSPKLAYFVFRLESIIALTVTHRNNWSCHSGNGTGVIFHKSGFATQFLRLKPIIIRFL